MDRKLKIDTKSIKKTIDRTPEDYEPEIEKDIIPKGNNQNTCSFNRKFHRSCGLSSVKYRNKCRQHVYRSDCHNFHKFDKFLLMADCIQSSHAFSTCDFWCWKLHIECAAS